MKLTAEENRTTRAKVTRECTVYEVRKNKDEVVKVDPTTFRNMHRKGLLVEVK